jgi:hypothetical protein
MLTACASYWRDVETFASYTCMPFASLHTYVFKTRAGFMVPASAPSGCMQIKQTLCYLLAWQTQPCKLEYTHVSRWHVQGTCMQLCQLQSCVLRGNLRSRILFRYTIHVALDWTMKIVSSYKNHKTFITHLNLLSIRNIEKNGMFF